MSPRLFALVGTKQMQPADCPDANLADHRPIDCILRGGLRWPHSARHGSLPIVWVTAVPVIRISQIGRGYPHWGTIDKPALRVRLPSARISLLVEGAVSDLIQSVVINHDFGGVLLVSALSHALFAGVQPVGVKQSELHVLSGHRVVVL
jgi:hypothetical protein